jgi:ribosome-associated protein
MTEIAADDRKDPTGELLHRTEKAPAAADLEPEDLAHAAAQLAAEKKAEPLSILDVRGLCSYADFFVIASAPSERQASAVARSVDDGLRRGGVKPLGVEGLKQGSWALLDFGDVVVHVFLDTAREYYDLEGFWSDAKRVDLDEPRAIAVLAGLGLTPAGEKKAGAQG